MQRTPPTAEQLEAIAMRWVDSAKEQLTRTGSVVPTIFCGDPMDDSPDLMVAIDPEMMNDHEAKRAITLRVKGEIAKHGYTYSIFVSDIYSMNVKPEKVVEFRLLQALGVYSFKELAAAGIGDLEEKVMVAVGTLERGSMVYECRYYREGPEEKVVRFDDVTLHGKMDGGMFKFF